MVVSLYSIVLLINPKILEALLYACLHWRDTLRSLDIVTPRSFSWLTTSSCWFAIQYCLWIEQLPICITLHFSVLNNICHSSAHLPFLCHSSIRTSAFYPSHPQIIPAIFLRSLPVWTSAHPQPRTSAFYRRPFSYGGFGDILWAWRHIRSYNVIHEYYSHIS